MSITSFIRAVQVSSGSTPHINSLYNITYIFIIKVTINYGIY
jgi:hypothetical protein